MTSTVLPQRTLYSRTLPRSCFTSRRPRHTHATISNAASVQDTSTTYAHLCKFIAEQGGYVHPALHIDPATGGIVAARDIAATEAALVELPLSIRLTTEVAQELLLPALNAAGLPTMSLLEESQQLALAVAWLRKQDSTTTVDCPSCSWQPYINTLPIRIPCGWAKSQQQLTTDYDSFLYKHGLGLSWWKYFVAQVQVQFREQADSLSARYSRALDVSAEDIYWALGQVTARQIVVEDKVVLEPWSDLLRHPLPDSSSTSSSRCHNQWSYGLNRAGTAVVSRGTARRIDTCSCATNDSSSSSNGDNITSQQDAAAVDASQQQQQQPDLLLAAGEELWASSSSSSGADDVFSEFIRDHGHLAPAAWYLKHGVVPQGLDRVVMRTSDMLDSWRLTVEAEESAAPMSKNISSSMADTALQSSSNKSSSSSSSPPTVLWDYLTQQYQQDVLTVLAATSREHQQHLLQWLMKPVDPADQTSVAEAAAEYSAAAQTAAADHVDDGTSDESCITPDVDPLPMISVLDELLLAAIDAADDEEV